MIEYRQTKTGKWRAYTVDRQAVMSWRGDNFKVRVIRDPEDRIVERATEQDLLDFLSTQTWYWASYEGVSLAAVGQKVQGARAQIRQRT